LVTSKETFSDGRVVPFVSARGFEKEIVFFVPTEELVMDTMRIAVTTMTRMTNLHFVVAIMMPPNDPSSATRQTRRVACNNCAQAGLDAALGWAA